METLTRRHFLHASAATVGGLAASLRWPRIARAAKELVVNTQGGAPGEVYRDVFVVPFAKESGIKVIHTTTVDFAKFRASVISKNVEWDVTELDGQDELLIAAKEGLLEPLDYGVINTANFIPEGVHRYGVANQYFATVSAYRTQLEGRRPRNWVEFWDVKKFPGARSLGNRPWGNLEFALMADGVPADKIYPIDIERAFRSLDRIKPHIKVWWKAGAQPAQLLADNEVDFTTAWNGRIFALQQKGVPVQIEWNQGALHWAPWVIPKGSRNIEDAMKFLAFVTQPKPQAEFVKRLPYPGLNLGLYKYLQPGEAKNLPTYPENLRRLVPQNYEWWVENRLKTDERWSAWIAS